MDGTRFTVHTPRGSLDIQSALVGEHNVSNLLASIGVGLARGMSLDDVRQGIRGFRTVPGRFEQVEAGQDFSVIVDYAHTEDALANSWPPPGNCDGNGLLRFWLWRGS